MKKIKKIGKPLARHTKKNKRRLKLLKSRIKKDITTKLTEIKLIIKEYQERLYANKLGVLDKFLEKHKLLNLIQEEIENLNRHVTRKKLNTKL